MRWKEEKVTQTVFVYLDKIFNPHADIILNYKMYFSLFLVILTNLNLDSDWLKIIFEKIMIICWSFFCELSINTCWQD